MSEEYKWLQVGSVVNSVLIEARKKAMQSGRISATGYGFLSDQADEKVVQHATFDNNITNLNIEARRDSRIVAEQLQLPFGIEFAKRKPVKASSGPRLRRQIM